MSDRDHIPHRDATIKVVGVGKTYPDGTRALNDVTITIEPGEFVVLVGPSGCGKSTLLRSIAGLESVTDGEIKVGDNVLNDVPPQERDLAMVFQNYALYPHLSVLDNIAFPLRMRGVRKSERRMRARETAELLELGELTERKPAALSGGQRQRVAMGRALIRNPIAFLMDEPLSNLDAKLRGEMRIEIEDLHQRTGVTFIYVTHDQTEAMTMADRVVAMQPLSPKAASNVAQIGTPRELYAHPESSFVASFIGSPPMNFFEAAVEVTESGPSVRVVGTSVPLPSRPADVEHVVIGFRPQAVMRKPNGETAIRLDAHATLTEFLGSTTEFRFSAEGLCAVSPSLGHSKSATGGKLFVGQIPAESGTVERGRQEFFLDPTAFHFFHPTSGSNLGGS